ncbi:hypothetical protein HNR44_001732 [Geomicrobium halophilum]|uniref:Uncharacterized protein n=1 Tax=Geomicrobium halophilum TaxID=549000 RepID=A0A841PPL5_9BACL|nr:hypothetical protein [Geomicrobium halophilum]MBB6449754.1 hypothetical protein [Geomicrobium halophilum]
MKKAVVLNRHYMEDVFEQEGMPEFGLKYAEKANEELSGLDLQKGEVVNVIGLEVTSSSYDLRIHCKLQVVEDEEYDDLWESGEFTPIHFLYVMKTYE